MAENFPEPDQDFEDSADSSSEKLDSVEILNSTLEEIIDSAIRRSYEGETAIGYPNEWVVDLTVQTGRTAVGMQINYHGSTGPTRLVADENLILSIAVNSGESSAQGLFEYIQYNVKKDDSQNTITKTISIEDDELNRQIVVDYISGDPDRMSKASAAGRQLEESRLVARELADQIGMGIVYEDEAQWLLTTIRAGIVE